MTKPFIALARRVRGNTGRVDLFIVPTMLDAESAARIRRWIIDQVIEGATDVTIDCVHVRWIGEYSLGQLVAVANHLQLRTNGRLTLDALDEGLYAALKRRSLPPSLWMAPAPRFPSILHAPEAFTA
jgi:hypothetical protein